VRAYRVQRQVQGLTQFLVAQAFHIAQNQRLPVGQRQLSHGLLQLRVRLSGQHLCQGVGLRVGQLLDGIFLTFTTPIRLPPMRLEACAPRPVAAQIDSNRQQPRLEGRQVPSTWQGDIGARKRLLDDVLRFHHIARRAVGQVIDCTQMPPHQLWEGVLVSLEMESDQFIVGMHHRPH